MDLGRDGQPLSPLIEGVLAATANGSGPFAPLASLAFAFGAHRSRLGLEASDLLQVSLGAFTVLTYCLPKMHARYFFAADIPSIVYLFHFPYPRRNRRRRNARQLRRSARVTADTARPAGP